jgi:SAM-dependent methyltransferase
MNTINVRNDINHRLLYAVHAIFEQGANRANNRIGDTDEEKRDRCVRKDGGYKCIHLGPDQFVSMLGSVLEHQEIPSRNVETLKFLDVGCGVGEKVYLASLFGLQAFGLELREPLIEEGTQLFKQIGHGTTHWSEVPKVDCFIQGDALKHDYKGFDILYFYCPLVDGNLQAKLETRIAKTAKKGAIVISAGARGCFGYGDKDVAGWQRAETGGRDNTHYWIRKS